MREQRRGVIVNISSMGGRVAFPNYSAYHGSKFALEGISESIRYEAEPFGIKVVLVEPGTIKSNFFRNAKAGGQKAAESNTGSSPYAPIAETMEKKWNHIYAQATPPEEVAKVILKVVRSDNPDVRYVVGNDVMQMINTRNRMSDLEFEGFIKQQFLAQ